jgi:hypothetical protein
MLMFGNQNGRAPASIMGASEGLLYLELTTSGTAWGRGPTISGIHGIFNPTDRPAWRPILMLASLMRPDSNTPAVAGFNDHIKPVSPGQFCPTRLCPSTASAMCPI